MKMIRYLLLMLSFLTSLSATEYCVAFVHIGPTLPTHSLDSFKQARLFNPNCPIYLIASKNAISPYRERLQEQNIELVPYESLPKTVAHKEFNRRTTLKAGFWNYTTARFFYLFDFMLKYKKQHVFHLENDNMLYVDLETLWPTFKKNYPGLGVTYDDENRGIGGFMYIGSLAAMKQFANFGVSLASTGKNDMEWLSLFRKKKAGWVKHLPIIMPSYAEKYTLQNSQGGSTKDPGRFSQHFDQFASVFDAAAIGQYLGGLDPMHANSQPGFINEKCLFNPSLLQFIWKEDEEGRKVPYMCLEDEEVRINSLHIHSKRLYDFAS